MIPTVPIVTAIVARENINMTIQLLAYSWKYRGMKIAECTVLKYDDLVKLVGHWEGIVGPVVCYCTPVRTLTTYLTVFAHCLNRLL